MATVARRSPFVTKPTEQLIEAAEGTSLRRGIGALDLTALGIGAIIGTGIFVIIGEAIGESGPALVISFVLAGVTCIFSALSYAELASTLPVSGSAYTYAYATMGEVLAWIIGWDLILEYGVSVAAVAVGWGADIVTFGALVAITSVVLTILYGQTRVAFSMCRDGLMPRRLATVWEKTRTPAILTLLFAVPIAVLAAFVPLKEIAELVNIGTLFAFFIVNVAVIWLLIGLVIYIIYGYRHSGLRRGEDGAGAPASGPTPPVTDLPLTGGCNCGAVRFEVTAPLVAASYCHCKRCQRRSGAAASANAHPAAGAFRIVAGEDRLRAWKPDDGGEKWFCGDCGSSLFGSNPAHADPIGIRMGAFDGDPGIRPSVRQFVTYAAPWEPIPDDGLPRHPESRHATG